MHQLPPVTGAPVDQYRDRGARVLDCDASTVQRAVTRGEVPAYRLGRRGMYRIDVTALREWARPTQPERDS